MPIPRRFRGFLALLLLLVSSPALANEVYFFRVDGIGAFPPRAECWIDGAASFAPYCGRGIAHLPAANPATARCIRLAAKFRADAHAGPLAARFVIRTAGAFGFGWTPPGVAHAYLTHPWAPLECRIERLRQPPREW